MTESFKHRARKRFGQNFLVDPMVLQSIVQLIAPEENEHIVEIGPGKGALTHVLLASQEKLQMLDLIEIDRDLAQHLQQKLDQFDYVRLHCKDVLAVDFSEFVLNKQKMRIIGNLPYNISSPLLFHLFKYLSHIKDMTFMLQKEVVERIVAPVADHNYSRLSVMVQHYCYVEKCFDVAREAFDPAPKVQSAICRLIPRDVKYNQQVEKIFSALVKQAFCYRRKTLLNALKGLISKQQIIAAGIDPGLRPQMISADLYWKLAEVCNQ